MNKRTDLEMNNDNELEMWLEEFKIELPEEGKIEETIAMLHQYVPEKKESLLTRYIPSLLKNAYKESIKFSIAFWISNLLYLIVGLSFVLVADDPYMALFLLAPLPVLVGIVDIFRSRDEGLLELELSLKHSPSQIILSKLLIIGIFNLVCNLVLFFIIHFFAEPVILGDLLRYWALPYTVTIALCLFLSIKFRTIFAVPITIAVLFTLGMSVIQLDSLYAAIPDLVFLTIFAVALIVITLEINQINKGVYHEFND
ncbi:hypothetical protein KHA96_00435 [Bacillus sp. FJAT-49711]|uniref:hypothetical protein n=1 Tax=Bacillus sp. FJAT-49711 TaxID=2833585 RepID=UPI001BCA1B52|nr:hypothetical protein [Bacillus sp. FJAT-49711]MBS4216776.1 hypothetical protein [Bacillus sp. FJAT-49711]